MASTEDLQAHQAELSALIYHGRLINGSDAQMFQDLPRLFVLFQAVSPFREDQALLAAYSMGNVLQIRAYLTRLQATMRYESFEQLNPAGNIVSRFDTEDMIQSMQVNNPLLAQKYRLAHERGLSSVQGIRGDGSCYFRSVIRLHIEQLIMTEDAARRQQGFTHLARLIRQEVLKDGSLFRQNNRNVERLEQLVAQLEQAASGHAWVQLQDF